MMSAASPVLYSGLPQEEWMDRQRYPKIISSGTKIPKPSDYRKANKAGLFSFLLFVLIAVLLALCLVLGLNLYKYPDFLHSAFNRVSADTENGIDSDDVGVNDTGNATSAYKPKQPLLINQTETDSSNSSVLKKSVDYNETFDNNQYEIISMIDRPNSTVLPKPLFASFLSEKDANEIAESAIDKIAPNPSFPIPDASSGDYVEEALGNASMAVVANDSQIFVYNVSSSVEINENSDGPVSLAQLLDKWTSKPNAEVVLIASGIIFIGLSLLVTAVTCLITKTRKLRRRRQNLDAVTDLGNNEKVILLTDDISEDEIVQT